jgi:hypothetical protein
MSEESRLNSHPSARLLLPAEQELLEGMLSASGTKFTVGFPLPSALVEDMNDGGMGSIRFLPSADQGGRTAQVIAQGEYVDEDGVPVSIAINADQNGELFEVDFWKVDVSPLKRYPRASDLKIDVAR